MSPNSVNYENAQDIYNKLYKDDQVGAKKPKFKEGDIIRVSKYKGVFDKSYYPNYTDVLYRISKVKNTNPPHYKIEQLDGTEITGVFYEPEIVKTTEETLSRIEEIIKTRTRKGIKEHFVSWVGYPASHNSWVRADQVIG